MESKPFMQDKCENDMHSLAEDMVYNKLEHECISVGTQEQLVRRYVACLLMIDNIFLYDHSKAMVLEYYKS
jgi:hypothetical protein